MARADLHPSHTLQLNSQLSLHVMSDYTSVLIPENFHGRVLLLSLKVLHFFTAIQDTQKCDN